MANMKPNDCVEKIVVQLRTEAIRLWGEQRATELEASLQQTAHQLWDLGQVTPHRGLVPGFYQ